MMDTKRYILGQNTCVTLFTMIEKLYSKGISSDDIKFEPNTFINRPYRRAEELLATYCSQNFKNSTQMWDIFNQNIDLDVKDIYTLDDEKMDRLCNFVDEAIKSIQ